MKIEIWSDFVCPFCYIGKKKLEDALKTFPQKDKIEIEFKSYQLDPTTPPYSGQDFYESMGTKFGGAAQAKQMMGNIVGEAEAVGLDFQFDTMKPTNTINAHRLTKFAKEHNKDAEISEKLFYANFTESKDIGNIDILAEIAEEVGLNKEDVKTALHDETNYVEEVNLDIDEAKQLGISGVPYFIFNRKYAISGAQSTEAFVQAVEKILSEEKEVPKFESLSPEGEDGGACGDDGCEV